MRTVPKPSRHFYQRRYISVEEVAAPLLNSQTCRSRKDGSPPSRTTKSRFRSAHFCKSARTAPWRLYERALSVWCWVDDCGQLSVRKARCCQRRQFSRASRQRALSQRRALACSCRRSSSLAAHSNTCCVCTAERQVCSAAHSDVTRQTF